MEDLRAVEDVRCVVFVRCAEDARRILDVRCAAGFRCEDRAAGGRRVAAGRLGDFFLLLTASKATAERPYRLYT